PAYGVVTVAASAERLDLTINHVAYPFEHWHYDVFSGQEAGSEALAKGMKAQFLMNVRGEIDRVELPLEPAVKPAVFTRRADSKLNDPAFLAKLAGEYQLAGQALRVSADAGGLRLFVPGQPEYELVPMRDNTFKIKILDGYLIRFVMNDDGTVKEMQADQPNGLFIAKPATRH
ncbi:MAG TPA: DUF3471 domain-containing protein, partial [Phycisphaerales bacterium]|nr:DUF3471 domain-containing protein [Phycisphaerales bacterium]